MPDVWIVDIVDDVLEVFRRPTPSLEAVYGWRYDDVARLRRGTTVFPLAVPTVPVAVADLLL